MSLILLPAWFVSCAAFTAAACIGCLSYMPRLIRLALILPTIYFAGAYLYASLTPAGMLQVEVVRLGLAGYFLAEIIVALPYLYKLHQKRLRAGLGRLKTFLLHWRSRGQR